MFQSVIVSMNFVFFFVLVQNVTCQRQPIQPKSIAPKHFLVVKILCRININLEQNGLKQRAHLTLGTLWRPGRERGKRGKRGTRGTRGTRGKVNFA